jgi:hypothetical protein
MAPAAISFAAGQAGFTLTLVFLFNIIQPAGWRVGLLRVEDIALGCAVSLVVGLLFWPRGAARRCAARWPTHTCRQRRLPRRAPCDFGMLRCDDGAGTSAVSPVDDGARAAAAAGDWTTPSAAIWPSAAQSRSRWRR